nr:reverse transcriptase domain-containing protein [Tanacetum cinerariifolium]
MGIYTPYSRRVTFTPLTKTPNEILAMEGMSFPKPPPLIGTLENHNLNKFYDYHGDKGHNTNDCYQLKKQIEEAVALGKLSHLVKDICQSNQRNGSQGRNDVKLPEKNYSLGTSAKITRAKLDKYSRDAGMSNVRSGAIRRTLEKLKAKNKVDLQPIEEDVQGTEMRYVGTKTQKGTTGPTSQTQTTPSPSTNFVNETIDILRTMIKELDHQTKAKATPRKLVYVDSEKEAPDRVSPKAKNHHAEKVKKAGEPKPNYGNREKEEIQTHRKMVDEMFERVKAFIRGEMAAGSAKMVRPFQGDKGNTRSLWDNFTSLIKTIKEFLAMEGISFPELPPLIENPKKQNLNKLCDYHEDKGHNTNDCYQLKKQIEEAVASGKLAHLLRDICWSNQKSKKQRRNDVKVINMIAGGRNHKRPYKEERSGLTEELTFPAIP